MTGAAKRISPQALGAMERVLRETYSPVGVLTVLDKVGIRVTNAVKRKLSNPGTGRVYTRAHSVHQASAPGEPPAVDTGRLRSSITWRKAIEGGRAVVYVGTNVEYAPGLEMGTSRMAARPFLRPAVNEEVHNITREIRNAMTVRLRQQVHRAGGKG